MKITNVAVTYEIASPRERPNRDALQVLDGGGTVKVRIEAKDGLSDVVAGTSSTGFGRLRGAPGALAKLIEDELVPELIGEDPFLIRGIRDKLWRLTTMAPPGSRCWVSPPLTSRSGIWWGMRSSSRCGVSWGRCGIACQRMRWWAG